jgi:hypothetical protein
VNFGREKKKKEKKYNFTYLPEELANERANRGGKKEGENVWRTTVVLDNGVSCTRWNRMTAISRG